MVPAVAHANMVWPALYLETRLLSIPVVALSLIIEAGLLHVAVGLGWRRALIAATTVNVISAALGVLLVPLSGIAWEVIPGLLLYKILNVGTFNPLTWAATFVLAVFVTAAVEVAALRWLFRLAWSRRLWGFWFLANTVSVGLAFASLAFAPYAEGEAHRLWLFR